MQAAAGADHPDRAPFRPLAVEQGAELAFRRQSLRHGPNLALSSTVSPSAALVPRGRDTVIAPAQAGRHRYPEVNKLGRAVTRGSQMTSGCQTTEACHPSGPGRPPGWGARPARGDLPGADGGAR